MPHKFKATLLIPVLVATLMLSCLSGMSRTQAGSTFNLGSPPSVVLAAMGESSRKSVSSLDDQTWYYGASWVRLVQAVVREYVNAGNLRVSLGSKSSRPFFIWLGCHRVTVIAALGTPTSVTRTTPTGAIWGYGKSSITMGSDKVVGWTDNGELKSHLKAAATVKTYQPTTSLRPSNGAILRRLSSFAGGEGELSIKLDSGTDAIVKLVRSGSSQASVAVYVRYNSTATVTGIPDGTYRLLYATGRGYEGQHKTFTSGLSCAEFDDLLEYETTTTYIRWTVTLYAVAGGNASSSPVSANAFGGY